MPRPPFILCALFTACLAFVAPLRAPAAPANPAAPAFAHESSDLKPDPLMRFGKLPNGLRYVIRPNAEPQGRASMRLIVETGSLYEKDDQRGLAHFLEHMAFNGSANYPADTLVEVFQRMGMSFGGDSNASTSFDRTIYMLELPDTRPATFTEGFRVFSDFAGGLLLDEKEIEKERGIILSEKRSGDSVGYRTWIAGLEFELGGTLFPARVPIGTTEVIEKAGRAAFLDFFNTWYRPERMAVAVVGDFDPAAVEKQLVEALSSLAARGPARPKPDYGRIADARGVLTKYHYESEAPATSVAISTNVPYSFEPDTAANRLKYLPRSLALAMLNRRLDILSKSETSTFTSGLAYAGELYDFLRSSGIQLSCRPDQWKEALATAEQEIRRALEHGFQAAELRESVANFRNGLEQAVQTASTRRSAGLAGGIVNTIIDREVYTTPADELALFGPALERVTVQDCLNALREAWDVPHRYIFVSGNAVLPGGATAAVAAVAAPAPASSPAERAIAEAYESSRRVAVSAPAALQDAAWAYTDFGRPGTVQQRATVADVGATLITFSNGVRLNLKKTDFEANIIRIGVRIGEGQLVEPRDKQGLALFVDGIFSRGGLGKHSVDDIDRILAGKTVGFGFGVGADALGVGAATNRTDLLLQFQLITAYLTDPGYRPEALRQLRKEIDEFYTSLQHELEGPLALEVERLLVSGDTRFGTPPKEAVLSRTVDEARAWLAPQLAAGAIEIAVVGDIDIDATIDAVARTLGALPTRNPRPDLNALRQVRIADPFNRQFAVDTEIPKGVVVFYWPTLDEDSIRDNRRLGVLASAFDDRLRIKVREELGGAYSPSAYNAANSVYKGLGFLQASVIVDPPEAARIGDAILAIADEISRNGITEDELARAKQPILTEIRDSVRTNGYWGRTLARAQEKPAVLDWSRTRQADFESITKAEVDALAKAYLGSARATRVTVLPKAPASAAPLPTPPAGRGQ